MFKIALRRSIFIGLFLIPFVPFLVSSELFFPFITTKAFAWRAIVEIVFAVWVLLALVDESYRPRKSLILYSVAAFLLAIGLANIFGEAPMKSFWSNFERMEGYITLLHLGAMFIVISSVFREVNWKGWWNTTLVASFLMVLFSLLQIAGLRTINQGGVRVDGTFGNATYLAVYMLVHFFIALFFLWHNRAKKILAWIYGILALLLVLIIYYTATRGAILGLLGGLLVVAILNIKNREESSVRKVSATILIGFVVLVGGFWTMRNTEFVNNNPVLSRFSTLSIEELKSQGRYFVWPIAFEGWKSHPILGWGQENFVYVFQEHYVPEMYRLEPWFDRAHNIFLDWAVAGGLLGLVTYLLLYVALLYTLWKDQGFSHTEKTIFTGLLAAYFFHNIFVFDHLVSYILFFSLLAYMHSRSEGSPLWSTSLSENNLKVIALPVVGVLLIASLYFINLKPLRGNISLIEALKSRQTPGEMNLVQGYFQKAYDGLGGLGRQESVEQIASNSAAVLLSEELSIEEKNNFYTFAREVVEKQSQYTAQEKEARYWLMAGSFLSTVGALDEALVYLDRARELIPGKQQVYLEIANAYLHKGEFSKSIEVLEYVGQISPSHRAEVDEYIRQIRARSL